ncbi:hypothetical protein SLA2020_219360 [Shorea laevis]
MASRFQAATLVASPSYPNSIAWSDENLIAVASGHVVTILNAALPLGPRGLITVHKSEPYPIGVVKEEDLLSGPLLSTCLSRDPLPCVRSISWSPIGMAPNSGCLLAVCTLEGHVKLYRPPFCDFCAEWIETFDITDRLYDYLGSISFTEQGIPSLVISDEPEGNHGHGDDLPHSVSGNEQKRRRVNPSGATTAGSEASWNQLSHHRRGKDISAGPSASLGTEGQGLHEVINATPDELMEKSSHQAASASKSKRKSANKTPENCNLPLISIDQYASRNAMLASIVVSWSPMLKLSSKICLIPESNSSNWFSLLAVGTKSGKISFWRIHAPHSYSIEQSQVPTSAILVGFLQAHNSWITTISWAFLTSDSSNPIVLLATGSSDGSVRIWLGHGKDFTKSSEVNDVPFFLSQEIVSVNSVPVSVVSLSTPAQSPQNILLAMGKGSGAFEVWRGDINSRKFDKAASYDAHDQVITGLAWAFDGHCLYSCSQDNFVRSWILCGSSLSEVPIPPSGPGLRSFNDLPDMFISCLGVALSPGNIAVAMVRSFDVDKLNQMYEARTQKAAVEFFWIGGQQWNSFSDTSLDFSTEKELHHWLSNILWSLGQCEYVDQPLVIWDIIAALLVFKQSLPEFFDHVLVKWFSMSFLGFNMGVSVEKLLPNVSKSFSEVASRKLHLLNIICRRVILANLKPSEINNNLQNLGGIEGAEDDKLGLWMELLSNSERELRQRLVGLTFSAFMTSTSNSDTSSSQPGYWCPVGLAQMEQWVGQNCDVVCNQVKLLASEIKTQKRSHFSQHEEQCSYCSSPVPFDSPEFAFCSGSKCSNGNNQKHELPRCAVSMQVCPATPLWLCKCCHRSAFKLPPETLFTMPRFSLDYKLSPESSLQEVSKPLCPLCGVLLQRSQPEFLLSALPV